MYWIETQAAIMTRRRRRDFCTLVRNYYEGRPYYDPSEFDFINLEGGASPVLSSQNAMLWRHYLQPTEDEDEVPEFCVNLVRDLFDMMILEVIPSSTEIQVTGIKAEDRDEYLRPILNFGENYPRSIKGLMAWVFDTTKEMAKVGEAGIITRFMPESKKIRLDVVPTELFDVELDPHTNDPIFYRVEYTYPDFDDGEGVDPSGHVMNKMYREDFWPNRVQRYETKALPQPNDLPPLGGTLISQAIDLYSGVQPIPMDELPADDIENDRAAVELAIFDKLGHGAFWQMIWHTAQMGQERGVSEVQISQLRCVDKLNRLLMSEADAAHNVGNPPLAGFDFNAPGSTNNQSGFLARASKESAAASTNPGRRKDNNLSPGSSFTTNSRTDKTPWLGYPYNQPTSFPYEGPFNRLRAAFFGLNNAGLMDPERISHAGQLTGFTASTFKHLHEQRVAHYRDRIIARFEEVLNYALQMAMLCDLIKSDPKVRIKFSFGKSNMTPDEEMKMMITNKMAIGMGVPATELGPERWPFSIQNFPELYSGLDDYAQIQRDTLEQQSQGMGAGGGFNPQDPAAAATSRAEKLAGSTAKGGVDNNAK